METELGHSLECDRGWEAFAYPNEKSMPKAPNTKHTQMKSITEIKGYYIQLQSEYQK